MLLLAMKFSEPRKTLLAERFLRTGINAYQNCVLTKVTTFSLGVIANISHRDNTCLNRKPQLEQLNNERFLASWIAKPYSSEISALVSGQIANFAKETLTR